MTATADRDASGRSSTPTQGEGTHMVYLVGIIGNPRYTVALMADGVEVGRFIDWLVGEAAMVGYVAGLNDDEH